MTVPLAITGALALLAIGAIPLLSAPASASASPAASVAAEPAAAAPDATDPAPESPAPSRTDAEPTPTTPPPTGAPDIASPVITAPEDGELLSGQTKYAGTAEPGSSIQVIASSQTDPLCTITASDDGQWACTSAALESSPGVDIRVVQIVPGHENLETRISVSVLTAPTAEAGGGGITSNGTVRGTAYPGAIVTATVAGLSCTGTADAAGAWFCLLSGDLSSGVYDLSATQTTTWSGKASPQSDPFSLTIDVDAPASPALLSPTSGTTLPLSGTVFAGTGEPGATVTVFAGVYSLCQSVVAGDGSWSCTGSTVATGQYPVSALQQDLAGNISTESTKVAFSFSGPTQTPDPGSTASGPGATSTPSPTGHGPGQGNGTGGNSSSGGSGDHSPSGTPDSPPPPADGGSGGVAAPPPASSLGSGGSWSQGTRFSTALQPAFGTTGAVNWGLGLAIALGIVGLVAAPARLLAGTVRRLRHGTLTTEQIPVVVRASRITGRNRSAVEFEKAPELSVGSWVTGGIAFLASAAISMLGAPIDNQPAYLRLLFAVVVGLLLVNAVATLLPALLAKRFVDPAIEMAFKPKYLLVSVAAAALSRVSDLQPALLFGLVFGLVLGIQASKAARGKVATLQILGLLVVGGASWLVSGALPADPSGVIQSFLAEVVNTVALASLGASSILLLPLGTLSGRAILRWKPILWLGLAVASFTLLGGLLAPSLMGLGGGAGALTLGLLAFGFAAISVSAWVWVRFIRPTDD